MWTYNLFEALRRLGVKGPRQPDLIRDQVLLAMLVGDVSELASPVAPPNGWFGGEQAIVAGEYSGFQVQGRGEGGCVITQAFMRPSTNGSIVFGIQPTNPAAGYTTALPENQQGPTAVQSVVYKGSSVTLQSALTYPIIRYLNTYSYALPAPVVVPKGHFATFQCATAGLSVQGAFHVRDVVAPPAET